MSNASHNAAASHRMSLWHDMIDWIGGYPFEVARPEEILEFYCDKGFGLDALKTCGGRHGCNEFVFLKTNPVFDGNEPGWLSVLDMQAMA